MKSLVLILASVFSANVYASLNVTSSTKEALVIPASASSCLARKQAGSSAPKADIPAAYFRIPNITFTKSSSKDMYIAQIKVSLTVPGSSSPYTCVIAGDALSALSQQWWPEATPVDSLIPAGTASLKTDCPLYCGNIPTDKMFSATATMRVDGYEQDRNSDDQSPVSAHLNFTVTNQ
ncbi:MAG TPA: hypothetical protein VF412_06580 [Bdellovibrio sp.]|uniref:hypothetical protein n=1 Tax=Bdellovibrio sp. TaxID=28201 RepID=UPI002EF4A0AB